jgi:hypothetical protein
LAVLYLARRAGDNRELVMLGTRTRIGSLTLDRRGFVAVRLDPGSTMELADAEEAIRVTWAVAGERRRPVLVDMSGLRGQSRDARLYFLTDEAVARYSAVALLVPSPVSRVIGTFILRLGAHKVPTRLFSSEAAAVGWLLEQVR